MIDTLPTRIVFNMGLGDIMLSNHQSKKGIEQTLPLAGEKVKIKQINENIFVILKNGSQIARLAKPTKNNEQEKVSNKILKKQNAGYVLEDEAEIEHIVQWQSPNKEKFLQVLCKIYMNKNEEEVNVI